MNKIVHDINNRDKALCYIDGNILIGKTHAEIISKYLEWEQIDNLIRRPESSEYSEELYEIAFGHIVELEKCIYLEEDSMENVFEDLVEEQIKNKFPDYSVVLESLF